MDALVITTHGFALIAALANPLKLWVKVILLGAIVSNGLLTWHRRGQIRGITLNPEGHWEVILPSGSLLAQLGSGTLVTPWIVILALRTDRRTIWLPIPRDAVDPESFRRLRVTLRIAGVPSP